MLPNTSTPGKMSAGIPLALEKEHLKEQPTMNPEVQGAGEAVLLHMLELFYYIAPPSRAPAFSRDTAYYMRVEHVTHIR